MGRAEEEEIVVRPQAPPRNMNSPTAAAKPAAASSKPGAVKVPGLLSDGSPSIVSANYKDSFVGETPAEADQKPAAVMKDDEPIVATLVEDEESQVQSQMQNQAKDIADMVHKQLVANATVPLDVQPTVQDTSSLAAQGQDKGTTSDDSRKKKRICLIAVALLAIVAAVAAGVGVAMSKKSPATTDRGGGDVATWPEPEAGQCSFCADGSIPSNLDTLLVVEGGQTCGEHLERQILLDSTDSRCSYGQALAFASCGCPTLPPPPENPICTVCDDGTIPSRQGCKDWFTFVSILGESPLTRCDDLVQQALDAGCTCDDGGDATPQDQCSFCFDGSIPPNLDAKEALGGQTCAQYLESQILLEATDPRCSYGQAVAWGLCGCPTIPPPPADPICNICANGATPSGQGGRCADVNTFVAIVAEGEDLSFCDEIVQIAMDEGCTCPDDGGEQCSFCADGSIPSNLETTEVVEGGQTCAQFLESQILLEPTDPGCSYGQAVAFLSCGCPTIPPPPQNPICTVCDNGATPFGQGCEDLSTLIEVLGEGLPAQCADLVQIVLDGGCTCPA